MKQVFKKSLLLYWATTFFLTSFFSFLFALAWNIFFYKEIFLVLGTLQAPVIYFLLGCLYFRQHEDFSLSSLVEHAFAWMLLSVVASLFFQILLFNKTVWEVLTFENLLLESGNFLVLLLAGWLVVKR